MNEPTTREIVQRAWQAGMVVPAFNIPYLPMMAPVVAALRDTKAFGLVMAARLEWVKFEARSIEAVRDEYLRVGDPRHTRLHLDHVPVIDEDDLRVDYMGDIRRAIDAGYESVMIDGSRLPLEENIRRTREVAEAAHAAGIPVEAELGAVMGHEAGPLPPYEELFRTKQGFTSPEEAAEFAEESGADWLSVAIGNIHGAVIEAVGGNSPAARAGLRRGDVVMAVNDAEIEDLEALRKAIAGKPSTLVLTILRGNRLYTVPIP